MGFEIITITSLFFIGFNIIFIKAMLNTEKNYNERLNSMFQKIIELNNIVKKEVEVNIERYKYVLSKIEEETKGQNLKKYKDDLELLKLSFQQLTNDLSSLIVVDLDKITCQEFFDSKKRFLIKKMLSQKPKMIEVSKGINIEVDNTLENPFDEFKFNDTDDKYLLLKYTRCGQEKEIWKTKDEIQTEVIPDFEKRYNTWFEKLKDLSETTMQQESLKKFQ